LDPVLALLLFVGQHNGEVSFEPYTMTAIERNLTELEDFEEQYIHVLNRLMGETADSGVATDLFALTLPYYSAVGYLMDSEDLEFYLRKVDPTYSVPGNFKRVAPPGKPIADPLAGDRISLLTFGMMYALLSSGYSSDTVTRVLEINGQQRDGLVLSEAEQRHIMSRIDGFNEAIEEASASLGPAVHLIDIGRLIDDMFTGKMEIEVGDRVLNRKWVRGSGFSLDGVHPGYTAQAFLANFIVERMNEVLGLDAPPTDLVDTLSMDPYVDWDGDGWATGPDYEPPGITRLILLFRDPDDTNPDVGVEMPPDVWGLISNVLLGEILDIPAMRERAETLGVVPVENNPGTE